MKKIFALSVLCVFLGACASQHSASNLSFVDVSLNYDSEDFDIVELEPVKRSASSFFGCTTNDESSAQLDRSTYIVGNRTSLGTATFLIGSVAIIASAVSASEVTEGQSIPIGLISTLLWGAYNDILWSHTVRNKAIERCNYSLVERYPSMDAFINPKYEISWKKGFPSTTCRVTLSAQGVVLKNKIPFESSTKIPETTSSSESRTHEELQYSNDDRIVNSMYDRSVRSLNYKADLLRQIAPNPSDVQNLSQQDFKRFKRIVKAYDSNISYVRDFEDYRATDFILSDEQFEDYWNEYQKRK